MKIGGHFVLFEYSSYILIILALPFPNELKDLSDVSKRTRRLSGCQIIYHFFTLFSYSFQNFL